MKTLVKYLFVAACLSLLVACNDLFDRKLTPVVCNGPVFTVTPNGVDDTPNLQTAFNNAVAAGPGSVVKLVEGEYKLGLIEVREFKGLFVGAGKGKTIITARSGLNCEALTTALLNIHIIKFLGGDVYMADMTMRTLPGAICSSGAQINGLVLFADKSNIYTPLEPYIKAHVNNVEFIGQSEPTLKPTPYNASHALRACSDSRASSNITRAHIDLTVTNCSFNTFYYGAFISWINQGVLILGTKYNGNVFGNCDFGAWFNDNINVAISAVDNTFNLKKNSNGLLVANIRDTRIVAEPQAKSVLCNIERNTFNIIGGYAALNLHDHRLFSNPEDKLPMMVEVKNNLFTFSDAANIGILTYEMDGTVIRNNKFTGTGNTGIAIAPRSLTLDGYALNGFIICNDFSTGTFSNASVWLNSFTKNWTVGSNKKGDVDNDGTDNVITGMNVKSAAVPLGQKISDNLRLMNEVMKDMDRE